MTTSQNNEPVSNQDANGMDSSVYGLTKNGAKTYLSSSNALLDVFSMIGSARNQRADALQLYTKAAQEDRLNAFKLLFWLRDCRGGASEKTTFQVILAKELNALFLAGKREMFDALLSLIPIYGYWKDLLILAKVGPSYAEWIFDFLAAELQKLDGKSSLLAKFMPRPRGGKKYTRSTQAKQVSKSEDLDEEEVQVQQEASESEDFDEEEVQVQQEASESEDLGEEDTQVQELVDFLSLAEVNLAKGKLSTYAFDQKVIAAMCQRLKLSKGGYRKLLVKHTNVVEQTMSKKQWNRIDYAKLPSSALMLYKSAFRKKDSDRYLKFVKSLTKVTSPDEAKQMNNTHLLPHELAFSYKNRSIPEEEFNAYWTQLKHYEGLNGILTMVDTSGSMYCSVNGSKYRCIDVSIGLGLYVSNAQTGAFKDQMIVFSDEAIWVSFNQEQTPAQKLDSIPGIVANTNFQAAYQKILSYAQERALPANEMPKALVVFSDMEFDGADPNRVAFEDMKVLFNAAGYELPKVVFWNLNGRAGNVQVTARDPHTYLVSGFSTSILQSFIEAGLEGLESNALDLMNSVLGGERYQPVQDCLLKFLA